jgi:hypothetical protein
MVGPRIALPPVSFVDQSWSPAAADIIGARRVGDGGGVWSLVHIEDAAAATAAAAVDRSQPGYL